MLKCRWKRIRALQIMTVLVQPIGDSITACAERLPAASSFLPFSAPFRQTLERPRSLISLCLRSCLCTLLMCSRSKVASIRTTLVADHERRHRGFNPGETWKMKG